MSEMYKNILVPIDFSEQAEKAFQEAVRIARRNQGQLTLISVVEFSYAYGDSFSLNEQTDKWTKESDRLLDEIAVSVKDVPITKITTVGSPKREIVSRAEQDKSDLIVMGATGKNAITRTLVGSTTAYVVNHAPCTVMVVR